MNIHQAFVELTAKLPQEKPIQMRLERAYDIVVKFGYSITKANNVWHVDKASTSLLEDNSAHYQVTQDSCSCPDFENAPARLCKHRLAVRLLELMERE